ncbi:MAG: magnesium transporter [Acidobacteria bacterium]|nr:MAG: magnesium transporter [Acidobacteriota bacterium]
MARDAKQIVLLDSLRKLQRRGATAHLVNLLQKVRPADIAPMLQYLAEQERIGLVAVLADKAPSLASRIIGEIHPVQAAELLSALPAESAARVLQELPSDDAAQFVSELPAEFGQRLLSLMKGEEAAEVQELLVYSEETAGRIMTPDVFALHEDTLVEDAIRALQQNKEAEMVFYLYVVDDRNHLVGVLSLRQLLLNDPKVRLKEIMTTDVIRVRTDTDQEEVARVASKYDLLAVPVVDDHNKLVGIITIDDVIDVAREEATEDFYKMAGTSDEERLTLSAARSVRSRLPWFFATFVGGLAVAGMVYAFSGGGVFPRSVMLAGFIPVILGMGGNLGTQSSTIIVRGLATGRIDMRQVWRVILKELRTAVVLGMVYGGLLAVAAAILYRRPLSQSGHPLSTLAILLGVSLFCSMMIAASIGSLVPVVLQRVGIDPAVATAPFVTTSVDVLGSLVFLSLSSRILSA